MSKRGILMVSFGTSHLDTLAKTIEVLEKEVREQYPEFPVYRAFTSQMVLKSLKEQGMEFDNVEQALLRMKQDGIRKLVVQPTHIIAGIEYEKMIKQLQIHRGEFTEILVGRPLLDQAEDYKEAVKALMTEEAETFSNSNGGNTALLLMGHGTSHRATAAYSALEYTFHLMGYPDIYVGTVEGYPDLEDVEKRMQGKTYRKICLRPFLLVAGDHAKNDMAGEKDSWKSYFEEKGYEVETKVRGLGECEAIRKMFYQHLKEATELE